MTFNLKNIYNNIIYGNELIAIEHYSENDNVTLSVVEATYKKDTVELTNCFKTKTVEKVLLKKQENPVQLVITSDQVLSKRVDKISTEKAIEHTFPNLNMEDFYFEIFQASAHTFVSVCRKDFVNKILKEYHENNIHVIRFHLGVYNIQSVKTYIDKNSIPTPTSLVEFSNESISAISKTTTNFEDNKTYHFGNETVGANFLLAFSALVNSISNEITTETNYDDDAVLLKNSYKEKRFFKLIMIGGFGILLLSLLINFFIFSSKYENFQKLNESKQLFKTQEKQLKKRIEDLNKKEALVKAIQYNGFSKSSNYIDLIIKSIPESITLENLEFQPILKSIKKEKKIDLQENYISISGKTNNKLSLNNWINTIQELSFISTVDIMNFSQVNNYTANFQIDLKLHKDDAEK